MKKEVLFGKLLHGGDYNPEQWLDSPEILEKDMEYFKKAGINVVSVGIFSWSVLEPAEGEFHFTWIKEIIDRLYKNGVSVILATPSGARPKWLADKYPEVLRVDANRQRNLFGGRHNHCYTSPVYREKVRIINTKLAQQVGSHPGVIAWHISNEFGGECHCPLCQEEFRKWLKEKYGTIEAVNKAWATTFWSHTYQDFSQIESPSPRGESALHGLNLDWKRFVTDRTVDFTAHEIKALRDAGSEKPATVNMMYDFQGLNYHKFKDVVDFISWDNYPQWHKKEDALIAMDSGMQHDIMRSIQKKPFLLMESCPSATNWQPVSKLKKPGMLHAASMQAIAHGSDSVLYFQIRQSRGSSEKFHGAVIDHYGSDDTRVFREVTEVGDSLAKMQEIAGAKTYAKAAVIHDWESRWAMEDAQGPRNQGLFYKETLEKSYSAFRKLGLDVDVIDMEQDLEGYQIVAAPMLYMFRAGFEEKVKRFVNRGGRFVLTYWSGIADDTDLCFLGGTPHNLMEVMGIRQMEIDGLYDWESNCGILCMEKEKLSAEYKNMRKEYSCKNLCELTELRGAKPLFVYGTDFYKDFPVLTENLYGKGKAYYICADMEQKFYDDLYKGIVRDCGIPLFMEEVPEGIEISSRENDNTKYVFIQNFSGHTVNLALPPEHTIWYGGCNGNLPKLGTLILKKEKK